MAALILFISAIILAAVLTSCVWVTGASNYTRTDTVTQEHGSNRINKADLGIRP